MTNLREAAQMALDVLIDAADSQSWELQQNIDQHGDWYRRSVYLKQAVAKSQETTEALRAALAQPEPDPQETIAKWIKANTEHKQWYICPKCSHQTPRWKDEWVGLTDEETNEIAREWQETPDGLGDLCRAIEAKLKEKNT